MTEQDDEIRYELRLDRKTFRDLQQISEKAKIAASVESSGSFSRMPSALRKRVAGIRIIIDATNIERLAIARFRRLAPCRRTVMRFVVV